MKNEIKYGSVGGNGNRTPEQEKRVVMMMDKSYKMYNLDVFTKGEKIYVYQNSRKLCGYEVLGLLQAVVTLVQNNLWSDAK